MALIIINFLNLGDDSVSMIKKSYHQNSRNFDNFGSSSGEDEHDMNKSKKFGDSKIDSDDSETSNNKVKFFVFFNPKFTIYF